mgnify:CR=1 FL=1
MPVIEPGTWWHPGNRPEWFTLTAVGQFEVGTDGASFDRHHHDCDELWLLTEGKAKILLDGAERYVQAGDVVVTREGSQHDVLEVYETIRGFFVEYGGDASSRFGHLDPVPHLVAHAPLPHDFPLRTPAS